MGEILMIFAVWLLLGSAGFALYGLYTLARYAEWAVPPFALLLLKAGFVPHDTGWAGIDALYLMLLKADSAAVCFMAGFVLLLAGAALYRP